MSSEINLSYVVTTRNKLPYLKEVMKGLLMNRKQDEEIVVADGASTDGTKEYLTNLYDTGLIQQFVTEPDKGEAHGYNKAILSARGKLIKLITDDDVFYYPGIQACKAYMLDHPEVDVMMGNTASLYQYEHITFVKNYELWYKNWLAGEAKNCFFCCLPLMLRAKSIPYLGLFDTGFTHIDLEYSVRISSRKAKIAWSTAILVVAIQNQQSNSKTKADKVTEEVDRVSKFYDFTYLLGEIKDDTQKEGKESFLGSLFGNKGPASKTQTYPDLNVHYKRNIPEKDNDLAPVEAVFRECERFLEKYNAENDNTFLI